MNKFKHIGIIIIILLINNYIFAQNNKHSLFFNGVNTFINTSESFAGESYSISLWAKGYNNDKFETIYTLYQITGAYYEIDKFSITKDSKLILNKIKLGNPQIISSTFNFNEWHQYTITVNIPNVINVYIDGILAYNFAYNFYEPLRYRHLRLGGFKAFKGKITNFCIYQKVLSPEEVKEKVAQPPTDISDLYFNWQLNRGTGNIAYDTKGTNNGTIENGTWSYDYPPYNGYIKLKEGLGIDTIGELGARAIIDITKAEFGFPNGLMMYQYGNKDSALVQENEIFPSRLNARSNVFWQLSERGIITADITFDYSQIKGIENPGLVKIIKRDSISDASWELVEETEQNDEEKTITLKNSTNFSQYAIGYTIDTNYVYLTSIPNNSINVDTTNINLSWTSDSSLYYKLFLGKNNPPTTLFSENIINTTYLIDTLFSNTKYYWRIIGYNKFNKSTYSTVWNFTTSSKENYSLFQSPNLSQFKIHYNNENSDYLIDDFSIVKSESYNYQAYGNTGFKYDKNTHNLVVNRFNWQYHDDVIFKDRHNNLIKQYNVKPYVNYIQGLALNSKDSSFWVAGSRPNWAAESGLSQKIIAHFDKNGQFLNNISMANSNFGMLDFLEKENALWVKESDKSTAQLISLNTLDTLKTVDLGMAGEGISVSPFDSTFWLHDSHAVAQVSKYGKRINTFPSPVALPPNAEDITVDPSDYTIWVGADEYLHGRIDGGNRVWHLDPLHTYNKDVFFPNMVHWREGILDENLLLKRDTLYIKLGKKKGYWTSPVIDFKEYQPETATVQKSNETYSYFSFKYRGSNTKPTTELNKQHALDYYSANNSANEGWGSVTPSGWTEIIPNFQYIQISVEISLFNIPPTAVMDTFSVIEENTLIINPNNLLTNDFDYDNYPIANFLNFAGFSQAENGSVTENVEGNLVYQPNTNFFGEDFFTYTNFDSRDSSLSEKVIINVLNVNDSPQIIGQNYFSIYEDQLSTFDINALIVHDSDNNYPSDFTFELLNGKNCQIIDNEILPNLNYNGIINVDILVNDGNEKDYLSNKFTFDIQVLAINDMPIITAQKEISISEDASYSLKIEDLIVSDIDNNFPINFSINAIESKNCSIINNIIIPHQDFFGELIIPITVNDGEIENYESIPFNLKISVLPINDIAIISGQNTININEDEVFQLTLSDIIYSDVDNSEHTLLVSESSNFSLLANNIIKPNENFNGTLFIPITLDDTEIENNISEYVFEINVLAVNDAPIIELPNISFNEDETSVSFNFGIYIDDIDNNINELILNYEENSNIEIIRDGLNFYFRNKEKNWFGTEKIAFTLSDGEFTTYDTLLISCLAVNDSPTITVENSINWLINQAYPFSFAELSVDDVDDFNATDFTINLFNGDNYSIKGNTIIPYTDFNGTIKVPVTVTDRGNSESNTSYIHISYFTEENAPFIKITTAFSYPEDEFVEFDISPYISDNEKPLIDLKIEWQTNPFVTISEKDKMIHISSTNENWNGATKVIFYLDNGIIKMPDTVLVTCTPVNDAPFINQSFTIIKFNEDESININLQSIFGDVDTEFEQLSYLFSENKELEFQIVNSILSITNIQENWNGFENINLRVSDTEFQVEEILTIHSLPINDAPNIILPNIINYEEDESFIIDFSEFISDADNSIDDLVLNWKNNKNINIVWTAPYKARIFSNFENWNGSEKVFFELFDGEETSFDTVQIFCNAVNDAPIIFIPLEIEFNEDEQILFEITEIASDIDNTEDELNIQISNNENINFSYQNNQLILSSKVEHWNGSEQITLITNDGINSVETELTIHILPINDAPFFTGNHTIYFNEDESTTLHINQVISDIDNVFTELNFTIESITEPLHIDRNSNILTIRSEEENWNGTASFLLSASDNKLSSTLEFQVFCSAVNDAPVIKIPDTIRFFEDNILDIDFSEYITDVDNKKTSFSVNWSDVQNVNIHEENLNLTFSNNYENWSGKENMRFTVSDNSGGSGFKNCEIIVIPINDAPIIESYYPLEQTITTHIDTSFLFETIASDIDSEIKYSWYINNKKTDNQTNTLAYLFDSLGFFEIKAIANDHEYQKIKTWNISVEKGEKTKNDDDVVLYQNKPNPFSNNTNIEFYLNEETNINLSIFNISGSKIKTLINSRNLKEGYHSIDWNGTDNGLNNVKAGVYFYKLQTTKTTIIKKALRMN